MGNMDNDLSGDRVIQSSLVCREKERAKAIVLSKRIRRESDTVEYSIAGLKHLIKNTGFDGNSCKDTEFDSLAGKLGLMKGS
jgi:hypothetical protein